MKFHKLMGILWAYTGAIGCIMLKLLPNKLDLGVQTYCKSSEICFFQMVKHSFCDDPVLVREVLQSKSIDIFQLCLSPCNPPQCIIS